MRSEKDENLKRKMEITPGERNDIELLIQSVNFQITAVRRKGQGSEGLETTLDLLRKRIDLVTWNNANDLEDWEIEEEAGAGDKEEETCVVRLEVSDEDRGATLDLVAALKRHEKGRSEV